MKIDIPGVPQKFSALKAGSFFKKISNHKEFGLSVEMDGRLAAIVFPETGPHRLQIGGLPTNVVHYPEAIVRASPEFLGIDEFAFGAVIKTEDGKSYIRVADGPISFRTFDLQTGMYAGDLGDDVCKIHFGHWKVGALIDGEFSEIFGWKPTAQA